MIYYPRWSPAERWTAYMQQTFIYIWESNLDIIFLYLQQKHVTDMPFCVKTVLEFVGFLFKIWESTGTAGASYV